LLSPEHINSSSFSYNGILEFTNAFDFTLDYISWLKQNINKLIVEISSSIERKRELTNVSSETKGAGF
jgi:hypothetical protein